MKYDSWILFPNTFNINTMAETNIFTLSFLNNLIDAASFFSQIRKKITTALSQLNKGNLLLFIPKSRSLMQRNNIHRIVVIFLISSRLVYNHPFRYFASSRWSI
jgi:hypothetical protein